MSWTLAGEIFVTIPLLIFVVVPSSIISQKHSRELYLLWYIFSVFFLLFFALNVAARWTGHEFRDFLGQYAFVFDWFTNSADELLLVGGIIYLGIAPQLLTYVLSGLFGSA